VARWWRRILRGSNASKSAHFHNRNGPAVLPKIDSKRATRANKVVLRGGRRLLTSTLTTSSTGTTLTPAGKSFGVRAHPAAMRGLTTTR
jgi:hypothetical protein